MSKKSRAKARSKALEKWVNRLPGKSGPVTITRPARQPQTPPTIRTPLGIDVKSDAFLLTYEWRVVRMQALTKYGAQCQCCGVSPPRAVMNVDHVKPRKLFPQLALDVDNLQILCDACNHGKSNWDQTDWRPVDDDPEVIARLRDIARNG